MPRQRPTYAQSCRVYPHRSFFRSALAQRARPVPEGQDPVHEYLIDQANLRGFFGAYSDRSELNRLDPALSLEDIVVGLLHPEAPAEGRVLKLVLRILQSEKLDRVRLHLYARRERALVNLAWFVEQVPEPERTPPILQLAALLAQRPPRETCRPQMRYDPARLLKRRRASASTRASR
jgi:hypothetical protein